MHFRPQPEDTIRISDTTYRFPQHPAAQGMVHGQSGRRGTVYQIIDEEDTPWALKVFLPQFREPRLVGQAERINVYSDLPGLRVCERLVLSSSQHRSLLREHIGLTYAVLMPWIRGKTWMEVILAGEPLTPLESLQTASALAEVLLAMEERGLAHCDLSGPNVILSSECGVQLVDLEEMAGPDLIQPEILPGGSPGYAHRSAPEGLWHPRSDRFSGAVLLAEMLAWCDARIVNNAWGEGYFDPSEMQSVCERQRLIDHVLRERWGDRPAELFSRAWGADTLSLCPTFSEWTTVLPDDVPEQQLGEKPSDVKEKGADAQMGLLLLKAMKAERRGDRSKALRLFREAAGDADTESRAEIEYKIRLLESKQTTKSDGWKCPVCGSEVEEGLTVCPHCEQGESIRSESVSMPARSVAAVKVQPGSSEKSSRLESSIGEEVVRGKNVPESEGLKKEHWQHFRLKLPSWISKALLFALGSLLFIWAPQVLFGQGMTAVTQGYLIAGTGILHLLLLGILLRRQDQRFRWDHIIALVLGWQVLTALSGVVILGWMREFLENIVFVQFESYLVRVFIPQVLTVIQFMLQGLLMAILLRWADMDGRKFRYFWLLPLGWAGLGLLVQWGTLMFGFDPVINLGMTIFIRYFVQGLFLFYLLQCQQTNCGGYVPLQKILLLLTGMAAAAFPLLHYLRWMHGSRAYLAGLVVLAGLVALYLVREKTSRTTLLEVSLLLGAWLLLPLLDAVFKFLPPWFTFAITGVLGGLGLAYLLGRDRDTGRIQWGVTGSIALFWIIPSLWTMFLIVNEARPAWLFWLARMYFLPAMVFNQPSLDYILPAWGLVMALGSGLTSGLLWLRARRGYRKGLTGN